MSLEGRKRVNDILIGGKVSINLLSSSQRVKVKNQSCLLGWSVQNGYWKGKG